MMTPAAVSSLHRPEGGGAASPKPPEQELKCPRCDSYNTKFCYYNNYSLSQPRYFCKTCRRYWTKGGALRNVPFGGGSRKNRKSRSTASLSSPSPSFRLSSDLHARNMQELGFFQLGGCTAYSTICGASGGSASGQVVPYGAISSSPFVGASSAPVVILDCPSPAAPFFNEMAFRGESPAVAANSDERMQRSLATSIESLSSINQDLHWKLQQKRLAMLLGGEGHHPATGSAMNLSRHHHSPSLVFSGFKELSTTGVRGGGGATACFLDNSTHHTPNAYATGGVEKNSSEAAAVDWMGTWNDVHAFSELQ